MRHPSRGNGRRLGLRRDSEVWPVGRRLTLKAFGRRAHPEPAGHPRTSSTHRWGRRCATPRAESQGVGHTCTPCGARAERSGASISVEAESPRFPQDIHKFRVPSHAPPSPTTADCYDDVDISPMSGLQLTPAEHSLTEAPKWSNRWGPPPCTSHPRWPSPDPHLFASLDRLPGKGCHRAPKQEK